MTLLQQFCSNLVHAQNTLQHLHAVRRQMDVNHWPGGMQESERLDRAERQQRIAIKSRQIALTCFRAANDSSSPSRAGV